MKKVLLLTVAILFGISASFAQVYTVNVSWASPTACFTNGCGTLATDYFTVTVSVYDNANSEYAVKDITVNVDDTSDTDVDVPVPGVGIYCDKDHDFTPSFTIEATVLLMDTFTNPATACCSGSDDYSPYNCHQFYNSKIYLTPQITLN